MSFFSDFLEIDARNLRKEIALTERQLAGLQEVISDLNSNSDPEEQPHAERMARRLAIEYGLMSLRQNERRAKLVDLERMLEIQDEDQ